MNEGLDEQSRQLMEKIAKLPRQYLIAYLEGMCKND